MLTRKTINMVPLSMKRLSLIAAEILIWIQVV